MFSYAIMSSSVLTVLVAAWLHWRWKNRLMLKLSASLPGPSTLPVLGNALMFTGKSADFLHIITDLVRTYGEYCRFWIGPQFNVVVANPHDIRLLLASNKMNQKGPLYDTLLDVIGHGILTGGATWRNHRKIVTPAYNKRCVQQYMQVFDREAELLVHQLCCKDPGVTFDVFRDVVSTTTQCVCQTLMGLSKRESLEVRRMDEVVALTQKLYALFFSKMTKWWYWPPLFQLQGGKRRQERYKNIIYEMTTDIIGKRTRALRERKPNGEDLNGDEAFGIVDRLILSGELSEKEIVEETFTLFTTSQEASAKIASCVLLFLAHLPEWQDKVYSEIERVLGGEERAVSEEELRRLPALELVYREALRYLPIAACIQRTVHEDIALEAAPVTIPAGTPVVIPIHALHRNPDYWHDPDRVMPERFLPEEVKKRDPNVFVPFSLGPMDCLGRVYATALIKTLVVRVVRSVQLVAPAHERLDRLPLEVAISTRFRDGANLRVRKR